MCLIHLIRQFSRARGLHVDLLAVSINDENTAVDPRVLMLYMRDLGVEFVYEADNEMTSVSREKILSLVAKRKGFNVIALGSTLDKLADDFLSLLLYKGKLQTNSACGKSM